MHTGAGGHRRGFRVPFTGIVSGFMSQWQGCCCWYMCFDRTAQKYLYVSRGLMHVWAVTTHLPAIGGTGNVRLRCAGAICCMRFKSSPKKTPVSFHINEKVMHSVWPHESLQHQYVIKTSVVQDVGPLFLLSKTDFCNSDLTITPLSLIHQPWKQNTQAPCSRSRLLCSHYYFIFSPSIVSLPNKQT